jgi:hypothetical protein
MMPMIVPAITAIFEIVGRNLAAQDRQPTETGDDLAQKFEPLASKIGRQGCQAGDVAARSRQTCDEAGANQVARHCKDDRDD